MCIRDSFFGVAGKQFGRHAGGGRHLAADVPQGVGLGQGVQLLSLIHIYGLSMAVYNRLIRAAAFRVIDL